MVFVDDDGFVYLFQCYVVEQNYFGVVVQCFFKFGQCFNFNLDEDFVVYELFGLSVGFVDVVGGDDVVFFDQDVVVEIDVMVVIVVVVYCVFLCQVQVGQGFVGVDDVCVGM